MFDVARRFKGRNAMQRVVEVGWLIDAEKSGLIWDAPKPYTRGLPKPASAKSVQVCPAAVDLDARHFVVPCPIDLHLRITMTPGAEPKLVNAAGAQTTVRNKHLNQMISIINRVEWRHPDRPILQITTPYLFLSDDVAYINQVPPYLDYSDPPWPGTLICGRFPAHIWPRHLMWAFEWFDPSKDLVIKRGDPWFFVRFETEDPSRPVRLIEADTPPEVRAYIESISGVTNYVNRTFSLFERAQSRRPKTLLFKKK